MTIASCESGNLSSALRLAEHGIAVFPCSPDKKPRYGIRWRADATTNLVVIRAWWQRWPDSIPAFEPGKQSPALIVIDLDRHGGPDGVAAFDELCAANGDDPRDWPTVETPSTGRHVFFLNPDGLTNKRGNLPDGIDVRGSGGFVVAEGATLPNGRSYRAAERHIGLVAVLDGGGLPALPIWLAAMLTAGKSHDAPLPPPVVNQSLQVQTNADARGHAIANKALAEDIAALSSTTGNRNETTNGLAYRLGRMIAAGWIDRQTVESRLENACASNGIWKEDGPQQCRATIRSGLDSGIQAGPAALAERNLPMVTINLQPSNFVTNEHDEPDDDEGGDDENKPIHDDLTRVPGILGDVIDFIVATARRPNRRMALGAALTICGTLIGRRMASPTGAATHLYVIATYPTGAGKQHQLDAIDRIMTSINLSRHIGPSQFMSMSSLVKHAERSPLSICPQDEFGAVLSKISHPKASGHEQAISMVLRSLWGANFATVRTPAYATTDSKEIKCPSLSLFGPTTAGELYEALKGRDVVNGFLNRFLVIDGGTRVTEVEPSASLRDVPAMLKAKLQSLYMAGSQSGNMNAMCKNTTPDPSPVNIPWASSESHDAYKALVKKCEKRMDDDEDAAPFFARVSEIALRCATIRACGRSATPALDTNDLAWGEALAWQSATKLKSDAGRYMTDPLGAAEFERAILRKIGQSPRGEITLRRLHTQMRRHFRTSRDLRVALDELKNSMIIVMEPREVQGGKQWVIRRL